MSECKFKAGDKVRRLAGGCSDFIIGDIYTVEELVNDNDVRILENHNLYSTYCFELVKDTQQIAKFKVGDRVKVVGWQQNLSPEAFFYGTEQVVSEVRILPEDGWDEGNKRVAYDLEGIHLSYNETWLELADDKPQVQPSVAMSARVNTKLRDKFAIAYIAGRYTDGLPFSVTHEAVAKEAYKLADAMLAARDRS